MAGLGKIDVKFGKGAGVFQTMQQEDGKWAAYSEGPNKFRFVADTKEEANKLAKEYFESLQS